ncbi:hypothetical protein ACTXJJ_06310 [Corynebacterium casei]|uniref:hypothetical protein n=1 Tax=Corynebacterium casei TaxID=160386 RepID=UPI003FB8A1EC
MNSNDLDREDLLGRTEGVVPAASEALYIATAVGFNDGVYPVTPVRTTWSVNLLDAAGAPVLTMWAHGDLDVELTGRDDAERWTSASGERIEARAWLSYTQDGSAVNPAMIPGGEGVLHTVLDDLRGRVGAEARGAEEQAAQSEQEAAWPDADPDARESALQSAAAERARAADLRTLIS